MTLVPKNPSAIEKQSQPRSRKVSTAITTLFFMIVIGMVVAFDFEKIKTYISQAGAWGILLSIIVYAFLGLTFIPSEPLTLLIGAMFGPWVAMLTSWVGNTLAAVVEYYVGQHLGTAVNFTEKKEKLPLGLSKLKVDSPAFLIVGRFVPLYGAKAISVIAGVSRVPLLRYVWTTAVSIFFGSVVFSFGGFGLEKLF